MHFPCSSAAQHRGGLRHGAAGGINIVAQQHTLAGYEPLRPWTQSEAASQLAAPLQGSQLEERRGAPHTLQHTGAEFTAALLQERRKNFLWQVEAPARSALRAGRNAGNYIILP